jgi:CRISPR-associated protein Cas1
VLVLDGFGIRVGLEGRALAVADGILDQRREAIFHPLETRRGKFRRLVIRGRSARLDLGAVAWCHAQGITLAHVSGTGDLLWAAPPPGRDDARLRRAQAQAGAPAAPLGLRIARELIAAKLAAEDRCLARLGLSRELELPARPGTWDDSVLLARVDEAFSATVFWGELEGLAIPWVERERSRLPSPWLRVGPRSSPLGGAGPRRAVSPFHAALNVLFAALELEATVACHAVGLDPGLGFLHLDRPGRASLACDLMEPVRPEVVAWLLRTLRSRPLRQADVVERPDGEVRCRPGFLRELWGSAGLWGEAVAPWAERVAAELTGSIPALEAGRPLEAPTPLTGRRRREAVWRRQGWGVGDALAAGAEVAADTRGTGVIPGAWGEPKAAAKGCGAAGLGRRCLTCGGEVVGSRRRCPGCAAERRGELRARMRLERRGRPRGSAPGATPEPAASVRAGLGRLGEALGWGAWEAVWARLQEDGPGLVEAGVSPQTVGRWRRGEAAPSRRWWGRLDALAPGAGG